MVITTITPAGLGVNKGCRAQIHPDAPGWWMGVLAREPGHTLKAEHFSSQQ